MKKLMIAVAAMACAFATQAASMKWSYSDGQSSVHNSYKIYAILGAAAATDWENEAAVIAKAIGDPGTIAKSGMNYVASGTATSANLTDASSVYFVIVNSASTQFAVSTPSVPGGDYVFGEQESEKATFEISSFGAMQDWKSGPGPDPTPEPTTGMLMLVGLAGLALRRRHA